MYRSGVDVLTAQRYLGHTDPITTVRIYTILRRRRNSRTRRR